MTKAFFQRNASLWVLVHSSRNLLLQWESLGVHPRVCQQHEVLVPSSPWPWLLRLPALEHADHSWLKWAVSKHAVSKDNHVSNIHSWLSFSCWVEILRCLLMGAREGLTTAMWIIHNGKHKHCFYFSFFLPDDSSSSSSSSFPQS